jgi:PhoH-like ATPase
MLKKIQVIDTNIFLSSPDALFELSKKYDVVIPFKVFEELDNNKRRPGTIGVNARKSIRVLDSLRKLGNLHKGVSLKGNKGKIFVELQQANYLLPQSMEISEPDNQIVSAAMAVKQKFPNAKVVFISNDINLRLKCDALGLESEDYDIPFVANSSEFYDGFKVVIVDGKEIDKFYSGKSVILKEEKELFPNQYLMLQSNSDEKKTALARFAEEGQPLKKLLVTKEDNFWGLTARNKEQLFALDAILNPEISLVTINGKSGSGKTLCALAAALEMVVAKKIYKKIIVIRPVVTVGKDIGYLPGSVTEKLQPFISPIIDNLNFLFGAEEDLDLYLKKKIIEVEAVSFIRGRSIPNSIIIFDETQNISKLEAKTVLTRVGESTKIILTGDQEQIDEVHVNEFTNGLTNTIEKFKKYKLSAHITLKKGERSELATLASEIL